MKSDANKEVFRCFIKILSPWHIGCDEVYEPTSFVMDETRNQLVVFNPVSFIRELSDEDKSLFSSICAKGTISSILEIYKFLRGKQVEGKRVDVCDDFIDHYKRTLSISTHNERQIQQELNNFQIPRTSFSSLDQRPYIPGSSVKGALRTGYANLCQAQQKLQKWTNSRESQKLERHLMAYSNPGDDPFRLVKVSDFMPVGEVKTKVLYCVNEKKKMALKPTRGQALMLEVIEPGAIFTGLISVEKPQAGAGIKEPVDLTTLLDGVLNFYDQEKINENQALQIIGIPPNVVESDEKAILIRCGRHSGAEAVTIKGHRHIRIMGKFGDRPKYLDHATTFWLASNVRVPKIKKFLQPFGWGHLIEMTGKSSQAFDATEAIYAKKTKVEQEDLRHEAKRQIEMKRQAQQEDEKKAREAEEKRIEEEKRKAAFEAMSPEEKDVATLEDPDVIENKVVEILNRLDGFSDQNKVKASMALKAYYQKNGKWKKKKCSKKQFEKVKMIKTILGEV